MLELSRFSAAFRVSKPPLTRTGGNYVRKTRYKKIKYRRAHFTRRNQPGSGPSVCYAQITFGLAGGNVHPGAGSQGGQPQGTAEMDWEQSSAAH